MERPGVTATAHVRTGDADARATPLVRLYAVYTTAFALALAFIVYVALTRLIVRPVEALARATDRVAGGLRKLDVPRAGARELVELSQSVSAMTTRLIADDEALRKKVDELTAAQAQIVRAERMASVGRLAAGMAHEIGNPITAIMGIQDLMIGGDVPATEQPDNHHRMRKETERVHRILRDLLDFARPEMPPALTTGAPPSSSVREVMRDVESLLKPQKQFRDVTVVMEGEDAEVPIASDRLTQVLLNLALNAGDVMGRGGKLTMRTSRDGKRTLAHRGRRHGAGRLELRPRPALLAVRDDEGGRAGHRARPRGVPWHRGNRGRTHHARRDISRRCPLRDRAVARRPCASASYALHRTSQQSTSSHAGRPDRRQRNAPDAPSDPRGMRGTVSLSRSLECHREIFSPVSGTPSSSRAGGVRRPRAPVPRARLGHRRVALRGARRRTTHRPRHRLWRGGYVQPTPVQTEVIPAALEEDVTSSPAPRPAPARPPRSSSPSSSSSRRRRRPGASARSSSRRRESSPCRSPTACASTDATSRSPTSSSTAA